MALLASRRSTPLPASPFAPFVPFVPGAPAGPAGPVAPRAPAGPAGPVTFHVSARSRLPQVALIFSAPPRLATHAWIVPAPPTAPTAIAALARPAPVSSASAWLPRISIVMGRRYAGSVPICNTRGRVFQSSASVSQRQGREVMGKGVRALLGALAGLTLFAGAQAQADPVVGVDYSCVAPAGDPAPNTPEWIQRDVNNQNCAGLRIRDQLANPAFGWGNITEGDRQ